MEQQGHIDSLFQKYLELLDEYTTLRKDLSRLQSNVYHNIARANFCAERGLRYGPDHFDERMQASRVVDIQVGESKVPAFKIVKLASGDESSSEKIGGSADEETVAADKDGKVDVAKEDVDGDNILETDGSDAREKTEEKKKKKKKMPRDPLHWFGILTPPPLRTAQSQSVQAVEQVIPRLVSVSAEMFDIEIEIRRAQKRRAKEEAAEKKTAAANVGGGDSTGVAV